jgi:hypothetical protein
MTAADLLTRLRAVGLTVNADGDALIVRPRELLTDELRAAIRALKRDLLAELPRYRWLVIEPGGDAREIVCLPEQPARELAACYPGARLLPLPDAAAEAAGFLDRRAKETDMPTRPALP